MNYSEQITEESEQHRLYEERKNDRLLRDARSRTRQSIWILVLIGAFNLLYAVWLYVEQQQTEVGIIQGIVALGYLALAAYAVKNPYRAILGGILLYSLVIILAAVDDPATLLQGIILKIIIIVALVKGLLAGKEVVALKKKLRAKKQ